MTSALTVFAQQQQQEQPPPVTSTYDGEIAEDVVVPEQQQQREQQQPKSLVDVARLSSPSPSEAPAKTLLDVAKEPKTLLDVAQNQQSSRARLLTLAADVQSEERAAAERRASVIQASIAATGQEVKRELQTRRQSQVSELVHEAVAEELAYQQDEFEKDDAVIQRAASLLAQSVQQTETNGKGTASLDRHTLKHKRPQQQLQQQRGCRSTPKPQTLKNRLSSFQCEQLTTTQKRLFLAMLVNESDADHHRKRCNRVRTPPFPSIYLSICIDLLHLAIT
ncbi:hypothetical protein PINS_up010087 [Pythium insidiosum]|nr:hypothetical protein PINS_up010087 [Pythium insidiosum]